MVSADSEGMLIKDFKGSGQASPAQTRYIDYLLQLAETEQKLVSKVNAAHAPYQERADRVRASWGFNFSQLADLIVDQEVYPAGFAAAQRYQERLDHVRELFRRAIIRAADHYQLGHLRFVRKNYETFVGVPFPGSPSQNSPSHA